MRKGVLVSVDISRIGRARQPGRYLLLDFDGVIGPLGPIPANPEWGAAVERNLAGMTVAYYPALVAAVEDLATLGVAVLWLTDWWPNVSEFKLLGFSQHEALSPASANPEGWWKAGAVLRFLNGLADPCRVAWCDDSLRMELSHDSRVSTILDRGVLGVCPGKERGLTRDELGDLTAFFSAPG